MAISVNQSSGNPKCKCCPLWGFAGYLSCSNRYLYMTIYDWDKCLFSPGIMEGPSYPVDGHWKMKALCGDKCVVVESTGGTASYYPVGRILSISEMRNAIKGAVLSDTFRSSDILDTNCGNDDGSLIFGELDTLITSPSIGPNSCGCTDHCSSNYNSNAVFDDGSCNHDNANCPGGCTDYCSSNYDPNASFDNGSCNYDYANCSGCTDYCSSNYDWNAYFDDGSCNYDYANCSGGCTDYCSSNYNPYAYYDDGSCLNDNVNCQGWY